MRLLTAFFLVLTIFSAGDAHAKNTQTVSLRPSKEAVGIAPKEVVGAFYRALEGAMKEGPNLGFSGRYQKLEAAFDHAFNVNEMMRTSYGTNWVKTTPDEKQNLTRAFRGFSISNYASQFKAHDGEVFEVVGEKKGPRDGEMIVETTLQSGTTKTALNYLMRRGEHGWQIVDVFVNGSISEMATRRSEFGSVVRSGGAPALIELLKNKQQKLSEDS